MEEINLKNLFDYFISKLRIILFITLVVVLIGAIYSLVFVKPKYEATTRVVLTGTAEANGKINTEEGITITQNDINLNSKLVATYREIIKSRTVLKQVINSLDLDMTVQDLEKCISVSTYQDTEMISITVSGADAEKTALIANELEEIFADKIKEVYNIENVSVIDEAEVPTAPVNMNILKQMVIYVLIGLVLSFAVVFAIFYFDTTIKDASAVEAMGFSVLASIPEKNNGGKRK